MQLVIYSIRNKSVIFFFFFLNSLAVFFPFVPGWEIVLEILPGEDIFGGTNMCQVPVRATTWERWVVIDQTDLMATRGWGMAVSYGTWRSGVTRQPLCFAEHR